MGFTDFISRIPSGKALPPLENDKKFVVANIDKIMKSINPSEKQKRHSLLLVQMWKIPIIQDYVITF